MILNPQHLKIFGENISIGDYATLICSSDKKIDISTWQTDKLNGEILIDDYVLMSPGTNLRCAKKISIGKSSMIASAVKNTFKETGTLEPSKDNIPKEKAISVAEGIAHPLIVSEFP